MKIAPLTTVVSLCVAHLAFAQEAPPAPPPSATNLADAGRVRWGVNAQVGAFIPTPLVSFGAEGRIGYSFNRTFAAYLSVGGGSGLFFGGSAGATGGSLSISVMSQWYVGAMAEANLGDSFFVALGPGIGRFSLAGLTVAASTTGAGEQVSALGGWTPSVDLKFGFTFGKRNPESGRRGGFTLAIDARLVLPTDSIFVSNGTGGQSVEVHKTAWGIVPMLMLGYDSH